MRWVGGGHWRERVTSTRCAVGDAGRSWRSDYASGGERYTRGDQGLPDDADED